ncbi:DUF3987 domain-containing protein [Massilia sp. NP310]|uniref:DUF3987 domain-containing protein n=1 Tax=Massilia sp. NP310 TaxID=2861282 RepID=UPI001C630C0C|nr:DUF3987 domain-containing protein [Massilia sp. NP310]QYG02230.1 DUF3987 domain-containing protein [Massilia sp. NP310]
MATKKKAKASSVSDHPLEYILALSQSQEAARNHAGAANFASSIERYQWESDKTVPPGTPLFDVLQSFKRHTDLPLDLSMHSLFFYLSTWLLQSKTVIECAGQTITPELWTIILAASGCGKTYSLDRLKKFAPVQANIMGIKSEAAFFDAMKTNEEMGRANAMLVDEVGQMIQQIEQIGSPLATLKESLLNAYGGSPITRATVKTGERTINDSTMTFLGLNVDETMMNILTPTSFLDGFCQRFTFVLAKRDPERHFKHFPRYDNAQIEAVTEAAWAKLTAIAPAERYVYTPEALAAYDAAFFEYAELIERDGVVNVSFFRRTLQRAHRLALLYHIILGKAATAEIDVEDVQWAMRLTEVHLVDAARIILAKSGGAGQVLHATANVASKLAERGQKLTRTTLAQNVRAVKNGDIPADALLAAYSNARGQGA